VNPVHKQLRQLEANLARQDANVPADDDPSRPLWFAPPIDDRDRRRALTRERVVAEALTIISSHGVDALTMRALATRLGVVPSALYRHVRNLQQLHDLVFDGVLAEVDCTLDRPCPGPNESNSSRADCEPSSRADPASPAYSRPATPSAPTHSP
jgi:hypothetical protein